MTSDSSTLGAEHHAGWLDGKPCSCGTGSYFATGIRVIEVDFMSPTERALFTGVRLGVKGVHAAGMGAKSAGMGAKTAYFGIVKMLKRIPIFGDKASNFEGTILNPDKCYESFKKAIDAWLSMKEDPFEINDVTHDAVEILYRCDICSSLITYTYDISVKGKNERAGNFIETRTKYSFTPDLNSICFDYVREKFDEMPSKYNLCTMNCKIWGRKFFYRFIAKRQEEERVREEGRRLQEERRHEQAMRNIAHDGTWRANVMRLEEERRVLEETRMAGERARMVSSGPRGTHVESVLAIVDPVNAPIRHVMLCEMITNSLGIAATSLPVERRLEEEIREKNRRLLEVTMNWEENETAARIEVREENLSPRGRNPLEAIEMPCRADYKCAMSSLDLYQRHEMYFYEHDERDPRWQRERLL
ncbi:hypothetical protein Ddc_15234 [Ditylenchus destructor]|nr:hypothetical protein Ddc_15234 [Ditylenchus destructor]